MDGDSKNFPCFCCRNGDRYAGEYFGDKIHGFGVYHFANGHCYEGAWHEGRRQGIGSYTFRNGDRRSGEWDAGNLKHPLPPLTDVVLRAVQVLVVVIYYIYMYLYEKRSTYSRTNSYINTSLFVKYNSYLLAYKCWCFSFNGVELQAARKTAENAINLKRVDDQVNRAVIAANRSATAARVAAVKAVQNRMDGKFCDTLV